MKIVYKRLSLKFSKFIKMILLRDKSLQIKIVTCYLFVSIPITIIGYNYYIRYSTMMVGNSLNAISQINQKINENIDSIIEDAENYTILFEHISDIKNLFFDNTKLEQDINSDSIETLTEKLKIFESRESSIFYFNKNFHSLELFTKEGEMVYHISKDGRLDNIIDPRDNWIKMVTSLKGSSYTVSSYKSGDNKESDTYFFSSCRAIVRDSNIQEVIGIVVINIDNKILDRILNGIKLGENSSFIIIDKDNNIIYSEKEDEISTKLTSEILLQLPSNGLTRAEIGTQDSYINCSTSKHTEWKVISIVPADYFSRDVATVRNYTIVLIIICFFIGFLITIFLSFGITKQLKRLTRLMNSTTHLNLCHRIEIKSKDEIGQLGRSFNKMLNEMDDLINSVYKLGIKEKQTKLDALQIQINPHFLYNTLETIRMLAELNEDYDVARISEVLGRMLRYGINNFNEGTTLREELEHLQNYLLIQNFRFPNRFDVSINIEEELLDLTVIKLIIQPIVENAIYHGMEGKIAKSLINITGYRENNDVIIAIEDNGVGMSNVVLNKLKRMIENDNDEIQSDYNKKSIGLRNVNERIRLYCGDRYGLDISSDTNTGTCVKIRLTDTSRSKRGNLI